MSPSLVPTPGFPWAVGLTVTCSGVYITEHRSEMEAQNRRSGHQPNSTHPRKSMETVGLGFCFEDLPLGRQFKTIGRTVTEPDIVNFINTIGMTEVLFTNLDFLKNEAGFKGRLAPGSLVYCF